MGTTSFTQKCLSLWARFKTFGWHSIYGDTSGDAPSLRCWGQISIGNISGLCPGVMSGVGKGVVVGVFVGAVVGLGMVFLLYRSNGLSANRGFVVYVLVLTGRAVD